jgi:hypothetical protein
MQVCPGTSVRKIRRLLLKNKGDTDKVINALYEPDPSTETIEEDNKIPEKEEEQAALDIKEKSVPEGHEEKTSIDKDTEGEIADISSPLSEISNTEANLEISDEKEAAQEKQKDVQVEEKREINEKDSEEETEKKDKKPRMLSASERKREKKMKQKEQKLLKDRAKAARKMQRQKDAADTASTNDISEKTGSSQSMKEMYI